jgi:hypothetical protein
MRWLPAARFLVPAVVVVVGSVAPAWGQTTVYTTNGFESPTFNLGNLTGQQPSGFQSYQALPSTGAAQVQNSLTAAGSHAVRIVGPGMQANDAYSGGNFWWRTYSTSGGLFPAGFNPVANGTPYVYASAQYRMSGEIGTGAADIPFAGMHFEGYTAGGQQQMLSPAYLNMNGGITVLTNTLDGQGTNAVTTADGIVPRNEWHRVTIEYDFLDQKVRVFLDDSATPLAFTRNGNNTDLPAPLSEVSFRNSFGNTVQFAEIGVVAYYGKDPSGVNYQPLNDFFFDDFVVTAQVAPVPEPGLMIAVGFAGIAAGGWVRRWRRGAKPQAA